MEITPDLVESHGLTVEEYDSIKHHLGREPNLTELGIFSVMWSEHCSYKSSRLHLRKLPTEGPQVIEGPGENAGAVDIGDGLAAIFKIESHNHPSFIEPYQGAATGVGGIIRDIFTMGARPIALLNSLHFGNLEQSNNQLIMEGVVAGIAGYGNCIGIPTVGGEIYFNASYSLNPIVNAFCLGLSNTDQIFRARATGVGNPVIYVGAKTGRDGIHGATMASEEFSDDAHIKRPTVQVGDPFMEKLLLEACLEAMKSGAVVGIQDMGAAGLTCSTCEMGSRSNTGIEIDLGCVPQREARMTPYEIMLSESQERMLLVAKRDREEELIQIFRKWDLDAVTIGKVIEHPNLVVYSKDEKIVDIPTRILADEAPQYNRPSQKPHYLTELTQWQEYNFQEPSDYTLTLLDLLRSFHLCSRRWVFEQYDHMVRTDTSVVPGSDAAVLRIKGSRKGLAVSLDGNSRFTYLDPRKGVQLAVAECTRNVACSGARPIAATNCLNFGNPENPEVMWQFIEAVEGMAQACQVLETPITGGNVSFYNETSGEAILPTPVLGIVGTLDDVEQTRKSQFIQAGDSIYLLGEIAPELGGSIYLECLGFPLSGPCPKIDLAVEKVLQETLLKLTTQGLVESCHDISEGGLALTLVECCFGTKFGLTVDINTDLRADYCLFSETPSCIVVSVKKGNENEFLELVSRFPVSRLGQVTDQDFLLSVNGRLLISASVPVMLKEWRAPLDQIFGVNFKK